MKTPPRSLQVSVPIPKSTLPQVNAVPATGSSKAYPLCGGLALRVPVVQASLGSCDTTQLASEVSRAGGLGTFTIKRFETDAVRRAARALRQKSAARPVLVALNQPYEPDEVLDICTDYGLLHFQVFWWNGPRLARRIHSRRDATRVFWQVSSVRQAEEAVDCGADVLILQGTEAGGQVRGPLPLLALLEATRAAVGNDVPIVAGGGLADRADVRDVLSAGAQAAWLGTRFLLSHEARADARWKARLVRANASDLTLDASLPDSQWPCAPRRRLDVPRAGEVAGLYAGLGIGRMRQVLGAGEIVRRLAP